MIRVRELGYIFALISLWGRAGADDAAIVGVGGAIHPMNEHSSVRLVREKVDVRLSPKRAEVRCEFVLKNEGKAITVKMGFPESAWGDIGVPQGSGLSRFRSLVDGKRVRTRFVRPKKQGSNDYRAWHVKNVAFAAGQTRTVLDTYSSGLGGMSDGSTFFSYVMRTGRSWKGKIGVAVITVDTSGLGPGYTVDNPPSPIGSARRAGKLVWTLKDFEPNEDISVSFRKAESAQRTRHNQRRAQ